MHALRANWYLSTSALSTSQESGTVPNLSGQEADKKRRRAYSSAASKKPIEEAPRYKTHFPLIPIMQGQSESQGKDFARGCMRGRIDKNRPTDFAQTEDHGEAKKVVQFTQGRDSLFPQRRRRRRPRH